jgi:hypothetical protein
VSFEQGRKDCREGIPHKTNQGEAYDRGYAMQYQFEQEIAAFNLSQEQVISRSVWRCQ